MWFRTRVGLVGVEEPVEIVIEQFTRENTKYWAILARGKCQQEVTLKGVLGRGTFSNPVSYLAQFLDNPDAKQSIGSCMRLIASSVENEKKVCDLSQVGDAQAWSRQWNQVDWS